MADFRFMGRLNDFLSGEHRECTIHVQFRGRQSIKHPQVGSQPAQVTVDKEARLDGTSVLNWMHLYPVFVLSNRIERPLLTVDLHPSDFGIDGTIR